MSILPTAPTLQVHLPPPSQVTKGVIHGHGGRLQNSGPGLHSAGELWIQGLSGTGRHISWVPPQQHSLHCHTACIQQIEPWSDCSALSTVLCDLLGIFWRDSSAVTLKAKHPTVALSEGIPHPRGQGTGEEHALRAHFSIHFSLTAAEAPVLFSRSQHVGASARLRKSGSKSLEWFHTRAASSAHLV